MKQKVTGWMLASALAAATCGCGVLEDMQYVRDERLAHEQPRVGGLAIPSVPPPTSANPALLDPPSKAQ